MTKKEIIPVHVRGETMVDQKTAREILEKRLGKNVVIVDEFENPYAWCFGLGAVSDDGTVMPILGDSTIWISKENGEMMD